MEKRPKKEKLELSQDLKIEFRDDPVSLTHLLKVILLAIEIADKSPEEAEAIQKKFLD